jgi:nucleoside-diphosphate-sugar epimerase
VTGAAGFIGRRTLAPLRELGFDVHGVSSRAATGGELAWHQADLLDHTTHTPLCEAVRPTHLLHLAWCTAPGRFWTDPRNLPWIGASLNLVEAFAACGGERVAAIGTCAEYSWDREVLSEDGTPLAPTTLYGASKLATLIVAEQLEISLVWPRVFWLYGPGEHPDRLVASIARGLLAGQRVPTSDGTQVRDYLHVDDVARGVVAALASSVEGPVNVASGRGVAVREIVAAIAAEVGRPDLLDVGALERPPGDPERLVADIGRLQRETGFESHIDLAAGIADAVASWR